MRFKTETTISNGSYAVDQRSGDSWLIGRIGALAIRFWKDFFKFRDVGREDCFCSEQGHPEFPLQEKGQSGGNESSKRRSLPPRKTDSLPDLRVLPGHWSQRFCPELCRPIYSCSSKWWYSGIRFAMGRNLVINDANPIWWKLGKLVQIKNTRVWETQDRIGIVQCGDSSEERKLRNKRRGRESGAKQREQRSPGDCWQWECSKGDNCSFRHDINKRAKLTQPNPSPRSSTQQNVRNASRTRNPRGRSPSGKMARLPCKDYHKGTCTTPFCEKWHPPECLFYKSENGCRFGEKCSYVHRQVEEQPSERFKKNGDKSAVAMLKITRQLGCVIQDMEPPKSSSILRKSKHTEANPMCSIHWSLVASRWHSRPKSIAWNDVPRWSSSA